MTHYPLVSVIMPVYNTQSYLERSIGSLIAQTSPDWELLAVDDGSTDNSLEKLNTLASYDNRIRVFHKQNEGIAKTRAFGLHYAKGDYFFYLDSDDWITPETLGDCLKAIQGKGCDASMPNLIMELPEGGISDKFQEGGLKTGDVLSGEEAFIRSIRWDGVHSSIMCRSDIYKAYACNKKYLFDDFASDELITRRILLACDKIVLTNGTYRYCNNPTSASKKISPHIFSYLETSLRLIEICHEHDMSRSVVALAETKALRDMIDLWHSFHKNKQEFSSSQRHIIRYRFRRFFHRLDKSNLQKLLQLKPGLTPRLQKILLLHSWTLCQIALNLSDTFNKENKLFPFFSNDLLSRLQ